MRALRRIGVLGFIVAAGVAASSCSNDVSDPSAEARVRFINASPDSPPLDILFDGLNALQDLGAGELTVYLTVNAGSPVLTMRPSGGSDVAQTTPAFAAGGNYTVLATGLFAALQALVLTDDNTIPSADMVRLRVVHVAPSSGALDVYVTTPGADLASVQPVSAGVSFRGVADYVSLPAGQYQIRVTQAGTQTLERDAGTFSLNGSEVHSVFILDAPGGGTPPSVAAVRDAVPGS
ncbi:MAG: DUF4397 domain-containing protein [Gemmatimonadales bacterium]